MVVLESWSHGVPVLMTQECNLQIGFDAGAAFRIEAEPESISRALRKIIGLPKQDYDRACTVAENIAARQFSWSVIAESMREIYVNLAAGRGADDDDK